MHTYREGEISVSVMDIFCSSPASTAIRSRIGQHAGDGIAGARRSFEHRRSQNPNNNNNNNNNKNNKKKLLYVPCLSSEMPSIPLPRQKSRRSSVDVDFRRKSSAHEVDVRRKSSADVMELRNRPSLGSSSSRYLLKDHKPFIDDNSLSSDHSDRSSDYTDRSSDLVPLRQRPMHSSSSSSSTKASSSVRSHDQVVVLRVSIHCKGCEGKVRKHISKMEGVTSYSIDLATKKVTVVGDLTPLQVLHSISRVKNAQFWPSSDSPVLHQFNHHLLLKN